ncbi:g6185 [Coccomyxa viridis]|uniref:G6185 protein n=1 Tax=Coccomyxa viridis TaxID=1274662 RepID=A0ABP1FXA5_9CHLO
MKVWKYRDKMDLLHVELEQLQEMVVKLELTHNTMEKEAEAVQKVVDQLEEKYAQMIATHTELRQGYIALLDRMHPEHPRDDNLLHNNNRNFQGAVWPLGGPGC